MPALDLRGRPIAITGASSGIGAATARAAAAAGMPVALGARRLDRLERLAAEITAAGGRAIAVECDVTREDGSRRLVERAIASFGSLYAVFANAGYGLEKPTFELSDTELRDIFETNFFGTMHTVRAALPALRAARAGHVLICSSCLAKLAVPYYGAYSATKAAQDHVGRAMRIELRGSGVHVSTVHPVGTRTEFFDEATPHRGLQPPEKVGRAIVRTLRRPRPEVWTSAGARIAFALLGLSPRLTDALLARAVRPGSMPRLRRRLTGSSQQP